MDHILQGSWTAYDVLTDVIKSSQNTIKLWYEPCAMSAKKLKPSPQPVEFHNQNGWCFGFYGEKLLNLLFFSITIKNNYKVFVS